ncbi:hypothetical protein ACQY0O_001989 [Thecaphora frezii]
MGEFHALYLLEACRKSAQEILGEIRLDEFIDEIVSGEEPREESPLYSLVQVPLSNKVATQQAAIQDLLERARHQTDKDDKGEVEWNRNILVVAGDEANLDPPVVTVIELDEHGKVQGELRCLARCAVGPVCNLGVANMSMDDFKESADDDGVFRNL